MFTFNRNEQIALLMLSVALIVGIVVSYIDRTNSDAIPEFDVLKSVVPIPEISPDSSTDSLETAISIDVNEATAKDFQRLPGIGPQIAQRIVDFRAASGGFQNLDDLTKVSGIGPKTLDRLRNHLTLKTP
jgi:comEA protein